MRFYLTLSRSGATTGRDVLMTIDAPGLDVWLPEGADVSVGGEDGEVTATVRRTTTHAGPRPGVNVYLVPWWIDPPEDDPDTARILATRRRHAWYTDRDGDPETLLRAAGWVRWEEARS